MRISFDLDGTLIFNNADEKLFTGECLRDGAVELLKELQKEHELWIYTTSFRSPLLLKIAFALKGIKIKKVINQTCHKKLEKKLDLSPFPTKYPCYYGIDLHIDDSPGVAIEGEKHNFNVLIISPDDECWQVKIKSGLTKSVKKPGMTYSLWF